MWVATEQQLIDMGVCYLHLHTDARGGANISRMMTEEQYQVYLHCMQRVYITDIWGGIHDQHSRAWEHVWGLSLAFALGLGLD